MVTVKSDKVSSFLTRTAWMGLFFTLSIGSVAAQSAGEFTPLFNGESLGGWSVENSDHDNFYVTDYVLRVEEPEGWLRSERRYADFELRVEFRFLTDEADSGVFVRVAGDEPFARGWPGGSYQVQTRDISKNTTTSPIWLGDLYRHRMPDGETVYDAKAALRAFKPTGEWQTFDIEVVGDSLSVHLNGTLVTRAGGIENPDGFIGLQGETDTVEFRSIAIRER